MPRSNAGLPSGEQCFLQAFEDALNQMSEVVSNALHEHEDGSQALLWRQRMRIGLGALLGLFDQEPKLARLCVIEALAGGPRVLERRAQALDQLAQIVDGGREEEMPTAVPAREELALIADSVVGGVFGALHTILLRDQAPALTPQLGQLMSVVVLPYLGPEAAAEELGRRARRG